MRYILSPIFFLVCSVSFAQNVGINTTTPQAALDINGDIIIRPAALTVSDGVTIALDVNSSRFSYYRVSGPTSNFTIAGISAAVDGRMITLFNRSSFTMQLNNEDPSAAPDDRIITGTNTDLTIIHRGMVSLVYDGGEQKWVVKSSSKTAIGGSGYWDLNGANIYNINSGNVGIGSTAPATKLTVQTALNTAGFSHIGGSNEIIVTETIGTTSASIGTTSNHAFRLGSNGTDRLHIYPSGKLVMGSASFAPASLGKLTIESELGYGLVHSDGTISVGTYVGGFPQTGWFGTISNHPLSFFANNGGALLTILQNGNVGVGTNNPGAKLHIAGGQKIDGFNTLEFGAGMLKDPVAGMIGYQVFSGDALDITGAGVTTSNYKIKFWSDGGAIFTGKAEFGGTVGIKTAPISGVGLHINHDFEAIRLSGNQPYLSLYNGSNYKGYIWNKDINDIELGTASGNTNGNIFLSIRGATHLRITNTGQVAINGFPAPYLEPSLTVNGPLAIANAYSEWTLNPADCANPSGPCLIVSGNGFPRTTLRADGEWYSVSDRRLKENIKPYKPVLNDLRKIQVSTYHLIHSAAGERSLGVIAQDMAQYFPEIVTEINCKDGERKLGISYAKTGVLAIKAIQEQQEIIEKQQEKIDELEKRLTRMEKLLAEKLK